MDITVPGAALAYNILKDISKISNSRLILEKDRFLSAFQRHSAQIDLWSSRIQFMGMASSMSTERDTLALRISSQPRKLYNMTSRDFFSEDDLLASRKNIILLGDPGSGKTTTVKRLIFRILHSETGPHDLHIDFPILVIAREMDQGVTLTEHICSILGAAFDESGIPREDRHKIPSLRQQTYQEFVYNFCRERGPLIVVDGIDETSNDIRQSLETELAQLAAIMQRGQIICTCRSGDFARIIDGFDVCELQPLSKAEQIKIVARWAKNPRAFMREARGKTYRDLLNRPLYLCQIILTFNAFGVLPERPSEVYRRVVTLALERWDRERSIIRRTKYSEFSVEQRLDFIACLAYNLTYRKGQASFSEDDILSIYNSIFIHYNLPKTDGIEIIREIESHSGLIVEGSFNNFEFSHLSIQEYLTARHIILQPTVRSILPLFARYPSPFAIATCISADHSSYFAQLIFSIYSNSNRVASANPLIIYLHRLQLERPKFVECADFGVALLSAASILESADLTELQNEVIKQFLKTVFADSGTLSVRAALYFFDISNDEEEIQLTLRKEIAGNVPDYPSEIKLKGAYGKTMINRGMN